jgi:tubulin epsilon
MQSFLLLHSLGGGTGSGVGTYILRALEVWWRCQPCGGDVVSFLCRLRFPEFPGVFRFTASVFPSEEDDVVTSPYNAVLALHQLVGLCAAAFDTRACM